MFLLVSGHHVGAHLGGYQHGVFIQISINLGKTFLRISSIRKIAMTPGESLCISTFFLFPDSGLNLFHGFDSILIYFEWRDTENQQLEENVLRVLGQHSLTT